MATHSSTLAWRIPWTEEPGGLQSIGSKSDTAEDKHKPLLNMLRECVLYCTFLHVCSHDRCKAHMCTDRSHGYMLHVCCPGRTDCLPIVVLYPHPSHLFLCTSTVLISVPGPDAYMCTWTNMRYFPTSCQNKLGFSLRWPPTEPAAMLVVFRCARSPLRNRAESAILFQRNGEAP